jgi:regulatory protein YycI of two-component signal transduction system YycFG
MTYLNEIIFAFIGLAIFIALIYFIKTSKSRKLFRAIQSDIKNQQLRQALISVYSWLKLKNSSHQIYSLKILMRDKKNKALCSQILALQHAIINERNFNPDLLLSELKKFK